MKRVIVGCIVVGLLGCGLLLKMRRHRLLNVEHSETELPVQPAANDLSEEDRLPEKDKDEQQTSEGTTAFVSQLVSLPRPQPTLQPIETNEFERIAAQLVSPQVSFQEKQALWAQLRGQHDLDEVISALERGATNNPAVPEYRTALGQAYINKIYVSKMEGGGDPREPAILGLKADRSFDAALALDPSNWEAQFFKAYSISYWPAELNKGPEVIERFSDLIEQQEKMPSQPQFAQSYVLLGEQYQKADRADYAQQVWQRGAAFFPDDDALRRKVATAR